MDIQIMICDLHFHLPIATQKLAAKPNVLKGINHMAKNTRLTCVAVMALAITSFQAASGAPVRAADRGGAKSVRPNSQQIRTSVDSLLGWRLGVSATIF